MNTYSGRSGHSTGASAGASALAESAVSTLSQRQAMTTSGTRQFVIDHMLRAVCNRAGFDATAMLAELRGHRLSVDAVIDMYVPAVARLLGDMWKEDDIDFATVTVGSMRLQALLSIASVESLDFIRPVDDALAMLVVVPLGEDHSLGAFVLAAQLRRHLCMVQFVQDREDQCFFGTKMSGHFDPVVVGRGRPGGEDCIWIAVFRGTSRLMCKP